MGWLVIELQDRHFYTSSMSPIFRRGSIGSTFLPLFFHQNHCAHEQFSRRSLEIGHMVPKPGRLKFECEESPMLNLNELMLDQVRAIFRATTGGELPNL